MRNCGSFNYLFCKDRKILYIVLCIVMTLVLTLTIVYAALSTTLNINGTAEISAASWDIYLDNVQLNSNSATTVVPTITDKTTASFSTTLSKPGDFYEFTIDVVNNGTIDAMIDSVTKTPELTDTQKKYLNYIVEYQNGEAITTKQLVEKNSFVRLRIKIGFRTDILASDIPESAETLNLSFKANYVQSDDNNENITIDNNGKLIKVVSGNYDSVGSEICIGEECFYVMSSDEESVTMFAKYNLYVGNECTSSTSCTSYSKTTNLQNSTMIGKPSDNSYPRKGTVSFALTRYWYDNGLIDKYGKTFPAYVYDSNSDVYNYVKMYKYYLESYGLRLLEARLIKIEELELLGCSKLNNSCKDAPSWIYATSYWSGSTNAHGNMLAVRSEGSYEADIGIDNYSFGVRPVVKISKLVF